MNANKSLIEVEYEYGYEVFEIEDIISILTHEQYDDNSHIVKNEE